MEQRTPGLTLCLFASTLCASCLTFLCLQKQEYWSFGEAPGQIAKDVKAAENITSFTIWNLFCDSMFSNIVTNTRVCCETGEGSSLLLLCQEELFICNTWLLREVMIFLTVGCGTRGLGSSKFQDSRLPAMVICLLDCVCILVIANYSK